MKILLIAILINATSGEPVAIHEDQTTFTTMESCGDAAQAKGIVQVHDNIATEYVYRQINDDGSPLEQWLKKRMTEQTEKNS